VLDRFSEIEDCIAVGQRRAADLDEQVLMFVKMKRGKLDDDLRQRICNAIRKSLSPRHVPAYVSQVQGIPYTVNGKKIENVVRDIVSGKTPKVSGTAVNPECLGEYVQYASLRRQREGARL
jgi:acetoacetyl-CoA synthetase